MDPYTVCTDISNARSAASSHTDEGLVLRQRDNADHDSGTPIVTPQTLLNLTEIDLACPLGPIRTSQVSCVAVPAPWVAAFGFAPRAPPRRASRGAWQECPRNASSGDPIPKDFIRHAIRQKVRPRPRAPGPPEPPRGGVPETGLPSAEARAGESEF